MDLDLDNIIVCSEMVDRVTELESYIDNCPHCGEGLDPEKAKKTNTCPNCEQELFEGDEKEELEELKEAIEELEYYSAIENEEVLIKENYFTDYCKELSDDLGYISSDIPSFITNNIDWSGVAEELKMDYSEIEINAINFYFRNS